MATLADIVNVEISLNTASVQRGNFGIPLIAAPLASFAERVRSYTDYDSTNPDNLPPSVMTALSDAFAQTPRPAVVKVGRLSIASVIVTPVDAVGNAVYSLKVGDQLVSVTAIASPTTTTIAAQLATAINTALGSAGTATASAANVTITYSGAVVPLTAFSRVQFGAIAPSVTANILTTDLGAIQAADSAWYFLLMTERTKTRVLEAAAWVETQDKMFFTASDEAGILTQGGTTDLLAQLKALNYFRTVGAYHSTAATEYADAAWVGRVSPLAPGSETWANMTLASVTSDNISKTQQITIFGKGGNTFERYSDQFSLTNPGKVEAGEWIDVIRFRDWLKDYIQTSMVQLMVNRDKIPYTDAGIQLLATNLRASLRQGQTVGGIAPDETAEDGTKRPGFNVTAPRASEVDDATKASRVVNLKFNARIAGAIHVAEITGALAYSLD
jgi:hypothetical protein